MKYENISREDLIKELQKLHRRLSDLEAAETERKQYSEQLRKSEERYKTLTENTSDWVWEVDQEGFYTYSNPKVRDLLGYEPKEVIGRKPFDFMPADEAKRIEAIFKDIVDTREPFKNLENINIHKNGHGVILETSGVPFFDTFGKLSGYRGIDRDLTERKRMEAKQENLIDELNAALNNVKKLSGMLPICANCKNIRDDKGYWTRIESYIRDHSEATFSHGICPDCAKQLYPGILD